MAEFFGEDNAVAEADRTAALELALAAADMDGRFQDYESALEWLDVAEKLNVALPLAYAEKREDWTRLAATGAGADSADRSPRPG